MFTIWIFAPNWVFHFDEIFRHLAGILGTIETKVDLSFLIDNKDCNFNLLLKKSEWNITLNWKDLCLYLKVSVVSESSDFLINHWKKCPQILTSVQESWRIICATWAEKRQVLELGSYWISGQWRLYYGTFQESR